ncbi:MAG: AAA family ATPase [Chloroflexi bacterium]|nr:AAA family ATPase [Chloroflexota bacterium]
MAEEQSTLSLTEALGVHGWTHLDAVLLAALATEAPLLLIGPHGTAKSLLIERVANALNMSLRHYNASLLNYDDLVGIPLPDNDGQSLHFVTTPGSIWDAEFVFFDEISRCRPDLQNKMFPIIHERRVVGVNLGKLRHRWAAMNPPAPDEPDLSATEAQTYFGSEPLDPALCDRFPYVIPVPDWKQLSKQDRRRVISMRNGSAPGENLTLNDLVAACAALIPQVAEQYNDWLTDYIVCVLDLLADAKLPQSPRRAYMLTRAVVAVHAARLVLEGPEAEFERSTEVALLYGLPQNATDVPPGQATLIAAHRQAWEVTSRIEDDSWRQVLEERDAVRRVLLAEDLKFGDEDLSRLVTQALGAQDSEARRMGLGVAMFLAFRARRNLAPSAWEPLAQFSAKLFQPRSVALSLQNNGPDMHLWNDIRQWLFERHERETPKGWLDRNFVLAGFPDLWRRYDWREALDAFHADLTMFGVDEIG